MSQVSNHRTVSVVSTHIVESTKILEWMNWYLPWISHYNSKLILYALCRLWNERTSPCTWNQTEQSKVPLRFFWPSKKLMCFCEKLPLLSQRVMWKISLDSIEVNQPLRTSLDHWFLLSTHFFWKVHLSYILLLNIHASKHDVQNVKYFSLSLEVITMQFSLNQSKIYQNIFNVFNTWGNMAQPP